MNMKKEREKRNLSRIQVAEKIGVSVRTVESWEIGVRNPSKQVQMLVETGVLDK